MTPAQPHSGSSSPPGKDSAARAVGRGALFIAAGKVVFLFAGATINFVLPRLLSKADYGNYGVVIRLISLLNMMTVIGLLQSVSKLVSEQPGRARQTQWRALRLAAMVGLSIAGLYALASPWVAGLLRDPGLRGPLALSAAITVSYGLYAVVIGVVNGLKRFKHQALLDMSFSLSKVLFILGGAVIFGGGLIHTAAGQGQGTLAAVGGFALAAATLATLGLVSLRNLPADRSDETALTSSVFSRRLLLFAGVVMLYQASLNGLMSVDLLLLKRHVASSDPALAGIYNGALNVAQLPYFGVLAITFVAFPLISSSTFSDDAVATRTYLRTAFRYGAGISVAVGALIAASATDVLSFIFPRGYEQAGKALSLLVLAYVLLSLHAIGCTLLNAAGHPLRSFAATAIAMAAAAATASVAIPRMGLLGAALGTFTGASTGLLLTGVMLQRTLGALPSGTSLLRIFLAGALVIAMGQVLPPRGALGLVPFALLQIVIFVVFLVATRELGRADLAQMLAPFRRARGR